MLREGLGSKEGYSLKENLEVSPLWFGYSTARQAHCPGAFDPELRPKGKVEAQAHHNNAGNHLLQDESLSIKRLCHNYVLKL
jgi:hypothetical protein